MLKPDTEDEAFEEAIKAGTASCMRLHEAARGFTRLHEATQLHKTTVMPRTNQTNLVLCTKIRFLNSRYYTLKMLPHLSLLKSDLPLKRELK